MGFRPSGNFLYTCVSKTLQLRERVFAVIYLETLCNAFDPASGWLLVQKPIVHVNTEPDPQLTGALACSHFAELRLKPTCQALLEAPSSLNKLSA